jgi:hypothetical protein
MLASFVEAKGQSLFQAICWLYETKCQYTLHHPGQHYLILVLTFLLAGSHHYHFRSVRNIQASHTPGQLCTYQSLDAYWLIFDRAKPSVLASSGPPAWSLPKTSFSRLTCALSGPRLLSATADTIAGSMKASTNFIVHKR